MPVGLLVGPFDSVCTRRNAPARVAAETTSSRLTLKRVRTTNAKAPAFYAFTVTPINGFGMGPTARRRSQPRASEGASKMLPKESRSCVQGCLTGAMARIRFG